LATKEEWMNYFESLEGRKPTLAEFEAAKKSGEIDGVSEVEKLKQQQKAESASVSEIRKIPVKKTHENQKVSRKGKITIIVAIVAVLSFVAGWFGYQSFFNSPTKALKDSVFVYNGKLVNASNIHGIKSDFSSVDNQYAIDDKLYFINGKPNGSEATIGALIDNNGKTIDKSLTQYNASVADNQLRNAADAKDGDGISSVQSIFYSKLKSAYFASKTDFNQGVIQVSKSEIDNIVKRRASGSFIILNDKYYMDEEDAVISFREIKSGKAVYNSKDNPELFAPNSYVVSNRYMISSPKKSGKSYEYKIYDGQDLKKKLFTLKLPVVADAGQLQGEWTTDGYTFITGKKNSNGKYSTVIVVNLKTRKVQQLKINQGDDVQIMGNYVVTISPDESLKIFDDHAKEIKTQTINQAKLVNVAGIGTAKEEERLNAAYAAVEAAEEVKADAETEATVSSTDQAKIDKSLKKAIDILRSVNLAWAKAEIEKLYIRLYNVGDVSSILVQEKDFTNIAGTYVTDDKSSSIEVSKSGLVTQDETKASWTETNQYGFTLKYVPKWVSYSSTDISKDRIISTGNIEKIYYKYDDTKAKAAIKKVESEFKKGDFSSLNGSFTISNLHADGKDTNGFSFNGTMIITMKDGILSWEILNYSQKYNSFVGEKLNGQDPSSSNLGTLGQVTTAKAVYSGETFGIPTLTMTVQGGARASQDWNTFKLYVIPKNVEIPRIYSTYDSNTKTMNNTVDGFNDTDTTQLRIVTQWTFYGQFGGTGPIEHMATWFGESPIVPPALYYKDGAKSSSDKVIDSTSQQSTGMDIAKIEKGDFSSIIGTWNSSTGTTVSITKDKITFTEKNEDTTHVIDAGLNYSNQKNESGPLTVKYQDGQLVFHFDAGPDFQSFDPLTFVPKGVTTKFDGNVEADRIFATTGTGFMKGTDYYAYKQTD
jgi:hypothetical protein